MVKDFKFFQKGTLNMMEVDETFATASFNDDTPEGHAFRRRIYHTDNNLYNRLRQSNNEMEQYFYDREMRRDVLSADIARRINGGEQQIRLVNTTTVTTVNPTLWTKIKIFGTGVKLVLKETWKSDPIGVVFVSILTTLVTIIGIAKLLGL
jgi:hypothetical protein